MDSMSFDITKTQKQTILNLQHVDIELSTWVRDDDSTSSSVASAIILTTGAMYLQRNISTEQCEQLIEILHQHLANVKENELELIAINTREAA